MKDVNENQAHQLELFLSLYQFLHEMVHLFFQSIQQLKKSSPK